MRFALFISPAYSEDAEIKLNSSDGSTGVIIQNISGATVSRTDSAGNLLIKGTMTVQGNSLSVGGSSLFVSTTGNVGIGTTTPSGLLEVFGSAYPAIRVTSSDAQGGGIELASSSGGYNLYLEGSTLSFWNGTANTMVLTNAGNVGIGTTSPSGTLHVSTGTGTTSLFVSGSGSTAGNVGIGTTSPGQKLHIYSSSAWPGIRVEGGSSGNGVNALEIRNSNGYQYNILQTQAENAFSIYDNNTSSFRLWISSIGNVGIGMGNPSYPLTLASGAYVTVGGVWTNASSREYKEDIRVLSVKEAMSALDKLEPVRFRYKMEKAPSPEEHVGFIAEDVPELVASPGRKGLSAMDIVGVLTKVVQEQQNEIASQRLAMTELQRQVKDLQLRGSGQVKDLQLQIGKGQK